MEFDSSARLKIAGLVVGSLALSAVVVVGVVALMPRKRSRRLAKRIARKIERLEERLGTVAA